MKCIDFRNELHYTKVTQRLLKDNKLCVTVSTIYDYMSNPDSSRDWSEWFRYAKLYFLALSQTYPDIIVRLRLKAEYKPKNKYLVGKVLYDVVTDNMSFVKVTDKNDINMVNEFKEKFKINPPIKL